MQLSVADVLEQGGNHGDAEVVPSPITVVAELFDGNGGNGDVVMCVLDVDAARC
jgi:hypothetical protein